MDWSDERYVRLYTRDTATWECLEWDGQCVFSLLLRKVDRAGVLDFGDGNTVEAAVKAVTRLPIDLIEGGLPKLLRFGVAKITGEQLVIIKFLEAQEATHSEKFRSKEYRARRRDLRRRGVTFRDDDATFRDGPEDDSDDEGAHSSTTQIVTKRDGTTTKRDAGVTRPIKTVTPSLAMPSRTQISGSQTKTQTRASARAVSGSEKLPEVEREPDGMPIQPRRKLDLLNGPVTAQEYVEKYLMPEQEAYALARGLTPIEFQATLEHMIQKTQRRGEAPATPSRWDVRLYGFLEIDAASKARTRESPKLSVVVPVNPGQGGVPWSPPVTNKFDGPVARLLFADDEEEIEGKEA